MLKLKLKNYLIKILVSLGLFKINVIKFNDNFCLSNLDISKFNILEGYPIANLINFFGQKLDKNTDPILNILYSSGPITKEKEFVNLFKKNAKILFNEKQKVQDLLQSAKSIKLSTYPWWSATLPWEDISIKDNLPLYINLFIKNRKKINQIYYQNNHLNKITLANKIFNHDLSWEFHALKFQKLYKSISKYGFNKNLPINVIMFIYKNNYRLGLSNDGNHRVRISKMLGINTIPLKVSKLIYFDDIKKWGNVKNGTYSYTDAKKIFFDFYNYSNKNIFCTILKKNSKIKKLKNKKTK